MSNKIYVGKPPKAWPILMVGVGVIGFGTIFYHIVEKFSLLNSLYFVVITLTTIGYGDIVPKTSLGKLFTIFYVLIGISLLAAIANYLLRHALIERRARKHPEQFKEIQKK